MGDAPPVNQPPDRPPNPRRVAAGRANRLKRGPLTIAIIANELGAKEDSIIKAAKRGKDTFQKVLSQDGIHRLALVERRHIA